MPSRNAVLFSRIQLTFIPHFTVLRRDYVDVFVERSEQSQDKDEARVASRFFAETPFACIIQSRGESFLQRMTQFSDAITPALDRAQFRAGVLELEWTLHGIRNNNISWWLAHIGGARDIMPLGKAWITSQ